MSVSPLASIKPGALGDLTSSEVAASLTRWIDAAADPKQKQCRSQAAERLRSIQQAPDTWEYRLSLDGFGLTSLPDCFAQLTERMTLIDLSGNHLTEPPDLSRCKALVDLNISRNLFTQPPCLSQCPNLTHFDASNNRLSEPPDLNPLTHLQFFCLADNPALARLPAGAIWHLATAAFFVDPPLHDQISEPRFGPFSLAKAAEAYMCTFQTKPNFSEEALLRVLNIPGFIPFLETIPLTPSFIHWPARAGVLQMVERVIHDAHQNEEFCHWLADYFHEIFGTCADGTSIRLTDIDLARRLHCEEAALQEMCDLIVGHARVRMLEEHVVTTVGTDRRIDVVEEAVELLNVLCDPLHLPTDPIEGMYQSKYFCSRQAQQDAYRAVEAQTRTTEQQMALLVDSPHWIRALQRVFASEVTALDSSYFEALDVLSTEHEGTYLEGCKRVKQDKESAFRDWTHSKTAALFRSGQLGILATERF
ncbi:MAG: Leucinerich repeat [Chlamydiota bacterium]|jgi:hypothetical protein